MIEKEYKWLVTKTVFYEMLHQMRPYAIGEHCVTQINYYYDSADAYLAKRQTTLRVRQKGDAYSLQTKQIQRVEEGCRVSKEIKKKIPALPDVISANEIGIDERKWFFLRGSLTTVRRRLRLEGDAELDFDINTYSGVTDYEIELEFLGSPPKAILELLGDIPANLVSKHQRFLKQKCEKAE